MHPKRGEFKRDRAEKIRDIAGKCKAECEFPADKAARLAGRGPSTEGYTLGGSDLEKVTDHTSNAGYLGPYSKRGNS